MQVGFMGRSIRPGASGVGRYAANLAQSLAAALPNGALTLFLTQDAPLRYLPGVRECRPPFPTPNEYARMVWEQTVVPARVARLGLDVYHSPNYILPAGLACPSVVTIHDLAYLRRSLHRLRSHLYLTALTALAIARATVVVAVSDYTRRLVEARYPRTAGRVTVVSEGVDPALRAPDGDRLRDFRARLGLDFPFILFVGTHEPRKNLVRLIAAFERMVGASRLPHHLVLAGGRGWKTAALDAAIDQSPLRQRIHRPGYVSDADLACWYAAADLFVYPSLEEGFGLPTVEAMACGTPVVTSNCTALPEVVGDAALTVAPRDVPGLATAMTRVLTEPAFADQLRAAGQRRAAQYRWSEAARGYIAVYERAAQGGLA